ncbi:MAG: glycosyltransferase family 39 protein, partial [Planctomycetota bacterium]
IAGDLPEPLATDQSPGDAPASAFAKWRVALLLVGIIALGMALRIACFAGYQGYDDRHYIVHAKLFSERGQPDVEHVTAWLGRTGVWLPMALAIRVFGPNAFALTLYSLLCGLASLVLVYKLGRLVFDEKTALLGTFFLAFFPLEVIYSTHPYADGPFGLFMVLTLYFFLLGERRGAKWCYLASGVAAGIAWLSKEPAVFLIFPFAILLLRTRTLKREYLLVLLGGALVVLGESAFWSTLVGDPMYRWTTIVSEYADTANAPAKQQAPTWQILLHLHQGGERGTISLLEPLVMFATNQEFGLFYYFLWPLLGYLIYQRRRRASELMIWTIGLALVVSYFPVGFPFPMVRIARYFTCLSIPAMLLLAYGLMQWRPVWRWGAIGILFASSAVCLYLDGSRHVRDNERELATFRNEHRDQRFWVDPRVFFHLQALTGFPQDSQLGVHFFSRMQTSHAFANVKGLVPDVRTIEKPGGIRSGYVVIRTPPGEVDVEPLRERPGWRVVKRIPEERAPSFIGRTMRTFRIPQRYIDRLLSPGEGERLTVWQVRNVQSSRDVKDET